MGIKCPLQDMFKGLISAASVVATALTIGFSAGFSAPALAGSCDSVKDFAQSLEQATGQKPVVECYEQEQKSAPSQTSSDEGSNMFLSLAALLAGGWGFIAILNMSKSQPQDWDYGFSPKEPAPATITSSPIIWWEEEIFNPSDLNWVDESSTFWWEDLETSTIEWNDMDISDIQWNDDEEIEWDDLSPIQWDDLI